MVSKVQYIYLLLYMQMTSSTKIDTNMGSSAGVSLILVRQLFVCKNEIIFLSISINIERTLMHLVCGLTSQSTAMVMSRRSINLTNIFLGKLRLCSQPVLWVHTFACYSWISRSKRITVINLNESMGPSWDRACDPWICKLTNYQ